jgi:hypothetical protein
MRRLFGSDPERRTVRALKALEPQGWRAFHDRDAEYGSFDHVVVGPAGVFVLETKALKGDVAYGQGGLAVHFPEMPRDDVTFRALERAMRSTAARLQRKIEDEARVETLVQPVVVIWGEFAEGVASGGRVAYVAGNRLVEWLASRESSLSARDQRAIELAFNGGAAAHTDRRLLPA